MKNPDTKKTFPRELPVSRHFRSTTGFRESLFPVETKPGRESFVQTARTHAELAEAEPKLKSVSPAEFYALNLWTQVSRKMLEAVLEMSQSGLPHLFEKQDHQSKELKSLLSAFPPAEFFPDKLPDDVDALPSESQSNLIENGLLLQLCGQNKAANYLKHVFVLPEKGRGNLPELLTALDGIKFQNTTLRKWLLAPVLNYPDSLSDQLKYIRDNWAPYLGDWLDQLLLGLDILAEEETFRGGGPGPIEVPEFNESMHAEYSPDSDWMPNVVMIAKNALVWMDQLSKEYQQDISQLDQIPDEALDQLQDRGFTALWLIGIWERSQVSKTIKQWMGQQDAESSAYSLKRYEVAGNIGGREALENLKHRARQRGIRLASDMVPNHTGLDSDWVAEHPDYFISVSEPPFPSYQFQSGNLSSDSRLSIQIEDHYYDHSDAAVVFKTVYHDRGEIRYIYHGNDGTSMPWNDTAQLDYLNPEVREAVIRVILQVARETPIIRFDAAMTLARRHIRRLWYPKPGEGGAIPSRAFHSMSDAEFNRRIPMEFWREVVNRVAQEVPDTLLLAEAFWMMEGYFVRTLGMHRVYNSAFMNMLKMEHNQEYRQLIKSTLEFDPEILKRYVNFLNNPDEETAVVQFGDGDKYFAVTTLMATLPGLPLFGHGQWEGFYEKYGMEFRRAMWDETQNQGLVDHHYRIITPLLKKRWIFAHVEKFRLFDFFLENGQVNENVFAYSNFFGSDRTLVAVNNVYESTSGWIKQSAAFKSSESEGLKQVSLAEAWELPEDNKAVLFMQEQRSGNWYLRSVTDIRNEGFFISLRGYESQVYWNIHIRTKDPEGLLDQLMHESGDSGMADPDGALAQLKEKRILAEWKDNFLRCTKGELAPSVELLILPLIQSDTPVTIDPVWTEKLGEFFTTNRIEKTSGKAKNEEALKRLISKFTVFTESELGIEGFPSLKEIIQE